MTTLPSAYDVYLLDGLHYFVYFSVFVFFFFFFQAEDGIRDGRVTGVQTCALPICPIKLSLMQTHIAQETFAQLSAAENSLAQVGITQIGSAEDGSPGRDALHLRSEERRVGKECRSRGWREE